LAAVVPPDDPAPLDELELLVAPLLLEEELLLELVVPPEDEDEEEDDEDELLVTPELLDEVPAAGEPFESLPPQAARIAANKETPSTRAVVAGAMRCSGLLDMNCSLAIVVDCKPNAHASPCGRVGSRQVSVRQLPIAYGLPSPSE
jgi:hypothetical protein